MPVLESLVPRVDAVIDAAVDDGRIVGTVVLVAEEGAPVYERAAGHADREMGSSTSIDTVFRLASLTKPMASAAALALVDRGWLALDDSITKFLPGFKPRLEDGTGAGHSGAPPAYPHGRLRVSDDAAGRPLSGGRGLHWAGSTGPEP